MSDDGKQVVLQMKYARVIESMADMADMSLEEAMDVFYNSALFPLVQDGTGDLHCRSDRYLAQEILSEREER